MDLEQCCRPRHLDVKFDGYWLKNNIHSLLVTEGRNTLGFATGLAPLAGAHGGLLAFFWNIRPYWARQWPGSSPFGAIAAKPWPTNQIIAAVLLL